MPQKALKVTVDLTIQAVTCPGTVLRDREDVYISIHFFGYQKRTLCLPPIFPLLFHQVIRFEKTFVNCIDPAHLALLLEDERILIELIQLNEDYSADGTVLAHFYEPAKEFLYPQHTLMSAYADSEREVLMQRTLWFSGIAPKLEFSCSTTVKDCSAARLSRYSELSAQQSTSDEDFLTVTTERPSRRRTRTKSYEDTTISWRSKSPSRSWKRERLGNTSLEDRPPFIIKRGNTHNRATSPSKSVSFSTSPSRPVSAPPPANGLTSSSSSSSSPTVRRRSPRRKASSGRSSSYISENDCRVCRIFKRYYGRRYWGHRKNFHPNHGIKIRPTKDSDTLVDEADLWLDRVAQSQVSDDTRDILDGMNDLSLTGRSLEPVAGLDVSYGRLPYSPRLSRSRSPSRSPRARTRSLSPITLSPRRRSRSPSPILNRSSLKDRYGDVDLDTSKLIHRRVRKALEHNFSSDSDVSSVTSEEALADLSASLRSENRESLRRSLLENSDRRYLGL
ncbi:serine/arginine repetitive matrix protein 1-like isoform X1 [Patiria miniata]|uniref:Spermatogenesis-associated protein 6 N-terminal domain-containing protein n=1 Tax=Patiria miniata TaxID=46514 RepID=A0A914AXU3_PATMI|nr:serine/arginine repetitive matrix protein 1-like isoform X1 [Patiria miniata]